ncbi:DUF4360 domain-containing protein [Jidongwangia harbinensis]|uniref:DUF4360 domain-containing protein n=1 Tax=Jidongwangia harbinensis TaxID=2878561 RepID=UPI001CD93063|nr:DUF4360 domain-containing protein [Jidongwangia harbinensis]MCA2216595.1 DUF4360 domain-containing protein [Jidongwangia harbinensis]
MSVVTATAVATALTPGVAAADPTTPPPIPTPPPAPTLSFDEVVMNGTGCPGQGDGVGVTVGGGKVVLDFTRFTARVGGSSTLPDRRKNCAVNISVTPAEGYTYTVSEATYDLATDLVAGTDAEQLAAYYYSETAADTTVVPAKHYTTAGASTDTHVHDAAALAPLGAAPCGQSSSVNVNSQVRFTAASAAEQASTITVRRATVHLTAVPC